MYFEHVRSPLKKGVDVHLGQRTVLFGPNGSGKTSVIQALELATRGVVNELEGRNEVKSAGAIARLFSDEDDKWAEAVLTDGTRFTWNPKSLFAPKRVAWPVQDLLAVIRGEEAKLRSWLEAQVGGEPTLEDVLALVDPSVRDVVARLAKRGPIDFLELAKVAKTEAKNLRSQATRNEKTIDKMVEGVPPALLPSQRQALDAELAAASRQTGMSRAEHDAAERQLEAKLSEYERVASRLKEAEADPQIEAAVRTIDRILGWLDEHPAQDECLLCGRVGANLDGRRRDLIALRHELPSGSSRLERRELLQAKDRLWEELKVLTQKVEQPVVDSSRRDALVRQVANDDAARRAWANADAERANCKKMRQMADHLTEAGDQLNEEGLKRLKFRKAAFEKGVSGYLPDGEVLGVDLQAARVGFVRGTELHSALSASELTRALLALCAASTGGSTLSILAPEDRSWDVDTLGRVMTALAKAPGQILLMSTVRPPIVEGWTLLEVG